jgi:hypothetical protein
MIFHRKEWTFMVIGVWGHDFPQERMDLYGDRCFAIYEIVIRSATNGIAHGCRSDTSGSKFTVAI